MKSGNPVLSDKTFQGVGVTDDAMTLPGTVNKTAMMLALVLITALWTWGTYFQSGNAADIGGLMLIGLVGGLIMALVTIFYKKAAPITAPLYALAEGLAIGGISAIYEAKMHGVVIQAVGLTFGTMAALLLAYKSGWIRATDKFKLGIVSATGGITLLYLVDMAMMMLGHPIGFIHEGGPVGILFSLAVVAIAALNLILDFDFVETGVRLRSPKYMEWYAAFALTVTLIWLYLEMLRLLSKARR